MSSLAVCEIGSGPLRHSRLLQIPMCMSNCMMSLMAASKIFHGKQNCTYATENQHFSSVIYVQSFKGDRYNETYQNSFRSGFVVTPVNGSVDLPVAWMTTKKVYSRFQFGDVQ